LIARPCRNYMLGKCVYGDSCSYIHVLPEGLDSTSIATSPTSPRWPLTPGSVISPIETRLQNPLQRISQSGPHSPNSYFAPSSPDSFFPISSSVKSTDSSYGSGVTYLPMSPSALAYEPSAPGHEHSQHPTSPVSPKSAPRRRKVRPVSPTHERSPVSQRKPKG